LWPATCNFWETNASAYGYLLSCGLLISVVALVCAETGSTVATDYTVVARLGDYSYTLADTQRRLARFEPPYRYGAEGRLRDYIREFVQCEVLAREVYPAKIPAEQSSAVGRPGIASCGIMSPCPPSPGSGFV
jgi:hypothetical protein